MLICKACDSKDMQMFFDLGNQPFANALLKDPGLNEKKYPLALYYCNNCGLVQLSYTADPKELFSNYVWVTYTSEVARNYADVFSTNALNRVTGDINYVLEIASNDGTFLKAFKAKGLKVLGVDPAQNIAEMAESQGIETLVRFFSDEVAGEITEKYGTPSIIIARNVMPHVSDIHEFVKGLSGCCKDDSLLILEIHYSGKILDELHYDSIYHEHMFYFTIRTTTYLLNKYGLYPFDLEYSPISGGSLVLYVKNKQLQKSEKLIKAEQIEVARNYNEYAGWSEFALKSFEHKNILNDLIDKEISSGNKILGYGASARSSTMLNFCNITSREIYLIADQNPIKQGLYTPGTHIRIVSPDEAMKTSPDTVIILAWNFKDEIIDILRNRYSFKGNIIVPLPEPILIKGDCNDI